ncbi:hypothetical protein FOA43_001256 [Brettanomyces nanus]|uniref:BHLH domain-containing protein n=1 Tax=Eeniella nana TaxID=13502 RepID=A0A875RX15_EENNA|nr:uncharacterized protein FOA43_001256 [Brettanomyces nanus]QPG73941.1 hypothetical protein FOA43_001256 [Brettanomyces nanus]
MDSLDSLEEYVDNYNGDNKGSVVNTPGDLATVDDYGLSGDGASPYTGPNLPADISNLAESLNFSGNVHGQINSIAKTGTSNGQIANMDTYGAQAVPSFKADDFFLSSNTTSQTNSKSLNLDDENNFASPISTDAAALQAYGSNQGLSSGTNSQYFSPRPVSEAPPMSKRSGSISNQLGKSYTSQLGTSLNNMLSPASTYDGLAESPYGSFQGSYNENYLNSPMNSPSLKAFGSPASVGSHLNPKNAMSKEGKLSRRRELHNAVERRRRDLIKEKIRELGTLIPPSILCDISKLKTSQQKKEIRANKSTILAKSVDYIQYLQDILLMQEDRKGLLASKITTLVETGVPVPEGKLNGPEGGRVKQEIGSLGFAPTVSSTTYSNTTSPFALSSDSPLKGGEDPDAYLKEFLNTTPPGGPEVQYDNYGEE